MMNKVSARIGMSILALAIASTGCMPAPALKKDYEVQGTNNIYPQTIEGSTSTLEGIIKHVQPNSIPIGLNSSAFSYPITFVLVKADNGENRALVYPYAIPIRPERAKITYFKSRNGEIRTRDLREKFIANESERNPISDNVAIKADGVIASDGIRYSEEYAK